MARALAAAGHIGEAGESEFGALRIERVNHDFVDAEVGHVDVSIVWVYADGVRVWFFLTIGV